MEERGIQLHDTKVPAEPTRPLPFSVTCQGKLGPRESTGHVDSVDSDRVKGLAPPAEHVTIPSVQEAGAGARLFPQNYPQGAGLAFQEPRTILYFKRSERNAGHRPCKQCGVANGMSLTMASRWVTGLTRRCMKTTTRCRRGPSS